jgi:hypothetical protein
MLTAQELAAVAEGLACLGKWHYLYLRDWKNDPPTEEIRRGGAALRRLLIDQELVRAWQAAGFEGQPKIIATNLVALIKACNSPTPPEFALAGAGRYNAAAIAGIATAASVAAKPASGGPGLIFRTYSFQEYLASAGIIMGRTAIARRDVVKYMAYSRGDADPAGPNPGKQDQELFERMSRLEARVEAFRKDGMLLEFISIGQTLTQSPDVEKLIRQITKESKT